MAELADDALERVAELARRMLCATDLDARLTVALEGLAELFGVKHAMVFVPAGEDDLVTIASYGYPPGGVGASVSLGQGVIGVAAERKRTVRVSHLRRGLNMVRAIHGRPSGEESETRRIPFVGIVNAQSQMAVPVILGGRLLGVLYAEDTQPGTFSPGHEHVVEIVAHSLARDLLSEAAPEAEPPASMPVAPDPGIPHLHVQCYEVDGSVFFDGEYVVKSLPGSILTKLLREHAEHGRTDFSLRELRLDPDLRSHAGPDNIDARLILLRRRLEERFPFVRIERTGRGRFRLVVERTIELERV